MTRKGASEDERAKLGAMKRGRMLPADVGAERGLRMSLPDDDAARGTRAPSAEATMEPAAATSPPADAPLTGLILSGVSGFYTIAAPIEAPAVDRPHVCKARGRFRKDGMTPTVGDHVAFSPGAPEGYIEEILPRRNLSARPPLANIDALMIVLSDPPQPDLLLVDRLLVRAHLAGIACLLVVNKTDLSDALYRRVSVEYATAGLPILPVSAQTGEGLEALHAMLPGKVTALAGQSGVGKTSVLAALFPERALAIGDISRKTARGRHTTRHAELLPLPGGGFVADTPGFSLLELDLADPDTLRDAYPEMRAAEGQCRFLSCSHRGEPDCAVRDAVARGEIAEPRWARYVALYDEMAERWRRKYE